MITAPGLRLTTAKSFLKALVGLRARPIRIVATRGTFREPGSIYDVGTTFIVRSISNRAGHLDLGTVPEAPCVRSVPVIDEVALTDVEFLDAWQVLRHSGRGGVPDDVKGWKQKFVGNEQAARSTYAKLVEAMRQGGVRLVRPDGTVDSEQREPRLRTRW